MLRRTHSEPCCRKLFDKMFIHWKEASPEQHDPIEVTDNESTEDPYDKAGQLHLNCGVFGLWPSGK